MDTQNGGWKPPLLLMLKYILNIAYMVFLVAVSPCLAYAALRNGKYREGWGAKLFGLVPKLPPTSQRRFWFHAVSVGEVNLLGPILEQLLQEDPTVEVVISTTTKTGYELASKRFCQHAIFYCPLDFSWAVGNAFRRLRPDMLVLVELELWPNLLLQAQQLDVPVAIVNGRLSDKSTRGYLRVKRWFPSAVTQVLDSLSVVGAQSSQCAQRFKSLGIPDRKVVFAGSIKFDGAKTDRRNELSNQLRRIANIVPQQKVFVAGSTQDPEERLALHTFLDLSKKFPNLRLILVPRHPERAEDVAQLLETSGVSWKRRTEVDAEHPMGNEQVLLVDTVGELGGWWGCAHIGFVGGSMGKRGGQNMLEPSGFGVATCFGPKTRNFRDVVEQLIRANAAVVVEDGEAMQDFVEKCLIDERYARQLGERAQAVVLEQRGATQATIRMLFEQIERPSVSMPTESSAKTPLARRSA